MRGILVAITLVGFTTLSAIAPGQTQPFRLSFSNTDVSTIVQAISLRTGADIVYGGPADVKVSLNVSAGSAEEALRFVTGAAAGVIFKRVGDTFIVASTSTMREAIEPFGEQMRLALAALLPEEAKRLVEAPFPYVTVRPFGSQRVLLIGAPDDLAGAAELIREHDAYTMQLVATRELIPLRLANGKQLVDMLRGMFPTLTIDFVGDETQAGGSLGLMGSPREIEAAKQVIATVDARHPFPEFAPQYHVYEIRYSSAPRLKEFLATAVPNVQVHVGPEAYSPRRPSFNPLTGVNLGGRDVTDSGERGAGGAGSPTASGGGQQQLGGERSRYLVLRGPADLIQDALALLAQVDVRPQQVMVEVKVVDTSPERAEELGLKWNWTRFGFYEAPPGTTVDTSDSSGPGGDFTRFTTRPTGFGMFSRVPWSFESVLGMMVQNREAKILATPSIQVLDNDEANIFIGDTIRARTSTSVGLGATAVEIVEFPVGIILLLRPRVNADGNITMRVHPVVSTVSAIDAQFVPQTSTREAETTVMVRDGETVVIGGLIRDEMSKVVREVPFLSRLPLVGELFRSRSTSSRRSEVLIFITPRIVPDTGARDAVVPTTER